MDTNTHTIITQYSIKLIWLSCYHTIIQNLFLIIQPIFIIFQSSEIITSTENMNEIQK